MNKPRSHENGNALWMVLLVVALLAALTATLSRSTDTTEQSGNVERYRIHATDIMRYASGLREAVNNMRMRGIGENRIDFTSAGFNNSCLDCLIFGSAGGGAYYRVPNTEWLDSGSSAKPRYGEWEITGTNSVPNVRSANPELMMSLGYLKEGLCRQINALLDITGVPADNDGFDTTSFNGAFAATGTINNMDGYESGCFRDTTGGRDYTFYQILVKR